MFMFKTELLSIIEKKQLEEQLTVRYTAFKDKTDDISKRATTLIVKALEYLKEPYATRQGVEKILGS